MRLHDQEAAARVLRNAPSATGPARPAAESGGPAAAERVRELQRSAGNAAIVQALGQQPQTGSLAHGASRGHNGSTSAQGAAAASTHSGETTAVPSRGGGAFFGHAQSYTKPGWQAAAEAFEQRLGAYAFRHPKALAAARATVNRLKQLLIDYARTEHKDVALANKAFFKNDKTSAGQVGTEMTTEQIKSFFAQDGNVREVMTAIYNAAYHNGEAELSLKQVLAAIVGPKPQLASTLGMNEEELKKQSAFLNGWSRPPLRAVANLMGQGYHYDKDPYALGNLLWQSNPETFVGDTSEMIDSQGSRKLRSQAEKETHRKTPRAYEDRGAPLSARELAFAGKPGPDDKLPWNEGVALWEIQQNDSWAAKNAVRGIPTVTGMSGTTTRMLKTFQWLNVPGVNAFDFRMAVMAWMLPSQDHSLYEILRGSWAAGVKGPGESATGAGKGAAQMYQNIAPFTEEELRQHVCVDGQFPHELVYLAEAVQLRAKDRLHFDRYRQFVKGDAAPAGRIAKWKEVNGGVSTQDVAKTFKPAHADALTMYSGPMHASVNSAVRGRLLPEWYAPYGTTGVATAASEVFSLQDLKKRLSWIAECDEIRMPAIDEDPVIRPHLAAARDVDPEAKREAMAVINERINIIAPALFEEIKMHADMTMEALHRLPPATGTVWRGDWNLGGHSSVGRLGKYAALNYRPGSVFTSSFDSTSRTKDTALDFMFSKHVSGSVTHPILLELTLTGKYGRDIDPFHQLPGMETEVLLVPGARFGVDRSEWVFDNESGEWYEHVYATEA